jgi:hypothetical protein
MDGKGSLRRIIPIGERKLATINFVAIELHGESTVIDLILIQIERDHEPDLNAPAATGRGLELSDDIGTVYRRVGGEGGGIREVRRMALEYVPAIPRDARYIQIEWGEGRCVRVAL